MASSTCADVFTICVIIDIECTLQIAAEHKVQKVADHGDHTISIPFTYTIGTDVDPTHTNFGFSASPVSGTYPTDITVTSTTFDDGMGNSTPDISGEPLSVKTSTFTMEFRIETTLTENITFDMRIQLNTGV